jgi:hypothetical protein
MLSVSNFCVFNPLSNALGERASFFVFQERLSINSHSSVAKKLSAMALSYASPTVPMDGLTPSAHTACQTPNRPPYDCAHRPQQPNIEANPSWHVSHVSHPQLVDFSGRELALDQIGRSSSMMVSLRRYNVAPSSTNPLQTRQFHQPAYAF